MVGRGTGKANGFNEYICRDSQGIMRAGAEIVSPEKEQNSLKLSWAHTLWRTHASRCNFSRALLAGWLNRRQLEVIEYLREKSRLLKKRLDGRRLRFTDAERRRLARRAYALGRKALSELDTLVTPDTLMRWYRTLGAQK